jgi:hypothetical protein
MLAALDRAEYRGLVILAKDHGAREAYERILALHVEIAE